MVLSKEQKRRRINQKKRKVEISPHSNMVVVRDLDEEQISPKDSEKKMKKQKYCESEGSRVGENKLTHESNDLPSWIVKLREELSCAVCLEICYEPTSTWCGHSFCRECLKLALKCDENCPKCGLFIGKVRSCNVKVNTVIWNIIQLLFPREVEAWKVAIRNDMLPSNIILSKEQWFASAELKFREQKQVAVVLSGERTKTKRMVVSEEQRRTRINQKKHKVEESPHLVGRDLDEELISPIDSGKKIKKDKYCESEGSRAGENKLIHQNNALPSCIDELREELSCAICFEICYEPASTWCGHSFCRRCLQFAAIVCDKNKKCPKCPKCRRSLCKVEPCLNLNPVVNVVVWNTIQLLFPQEVEARKDAIMNDM